MVRPAVPQSDFAAVFDAFHIEPGSRVLLAVSGGSDSLALLHLAHDILKPRGVSLHAATVDHGLRAEARSEAIAVGTLCAGLSIPHQILVWSGDKPSTGLAAAARMARYRLLAEAADAASCSMILTGHTLDDQAETLAMRAARPGAGWERGAAGMAAATLLHGRHWLLRPLLGQRREALRAMLRGQSIDWIDDPSNANTDAERVRVRETLSDDDIIRLGETADMAAIHRTLMGGGIADLIDARARLTATGLVEIPARTVEREGGALALAMLLAVTGGEAHLASRSAVEALIATVGKDGASATLSRCVVERRRGTLLVRRELRNLPGPKKLKAGDIWDGRYRALRDVEVRVGGDAKAAPAGDASATPRMIGEALAAEPDERSALVRILAQWADFLPAFDLAPAAAFARLFGAAQPPAAPLR